MRRPRFIAEQARNAHGLLGRLIAFIMARETWAQNVRAIEALAVESRDQILDIGCGHGRSLAALAARAPQGRVVGADPSPLMVELARRRNRRLVAAQRVEVAVAGVEALPFPDAAFDRVLCVHVIYFWPDLAAAAQEIARVLKPGGRLAIVFRSTADAAAIESFPAEVYRFRPLEQAMAAFREAGLTPTPPVTDAEPLLLIAAKPAA